MVMPTPPSFAGPNLALLMLGGYRKLVDTAVVEFEARGFEDVRASENFAMRAIESGADNASELGRRMSVTKQAAAKTIDALLHRGYITRDADPTNARRKRLALTPLGTDLLRQGEEDVQQTARPAPETDRAQGTGRAGNSPGRARGRHSCTT